MSMTQRRSVAERSHLMIGLQRGEAGRKGTFNFFYESPLDRLDVTFGAPG
jgi:hypothetical protein